MLWLITNIVDILGDMFFFLPVLADSQTCSKCNDDVCTGNILGEVIAQQKLTSGYFGSYKPKGNALNNSNK